MNLRTQIICIFTATTLIHSLAWAEIRNDKLEPKTRTKPTLAAGIENQPRGALRQVSEHSVVRFYHELGYLPVWVGPNGLLKPGEVLLKIIENDAKEGLFPDGHRFSVPETSLVDNLYALGQQQTFSPRLASHEQDDILLTAAILKYAKHLAEGRVVPKEMEGKWQSRHRSMEIDIPIELAHAVKESRLFSFIDSLHPERDDYQRLRKALRAYEKIRRAGGWPSIPPGPTLAKGDRSSRVEALRTRLEMTGDDPGTEPMDRMLFDEHLEIALKNFQHRHGLKTDGLAGQATLSELNVPVKQRILQLQLNMERWRWFPESFGERYILVNIPAYELSIVEANRRIERMRVIVGKKKRQTPVMSDRMTYLEFNPYWNIPQRIARKDILPKVLKDPDYLIRQGIRIFDGWNQEAQELDPTQIAWHDFSSGRFPYRLRQDPSDSNALGQIKFIFPNRHSIYIHDTPGKKLFQRQDRFLSSGCVRVEDPITLAHYLLSDQGWTHQRVEATIAQGKHQTVILDEPIPVHLVYFTAWVDMDQNVQFRKDIYGWDERLGLTLQNSAPELFAGNRDNQEPNLMAIVRPTAEATFPLAN